MFVADTPDGRVDLIGGQLLLPADDNRFLKHGGGRSRVELEAAAVVAEGTSEDLEALDEALNKLAAEDTLKAELVKLRFFAGLTMPEIAQVLKISLATAERHRTYARTWLFAELKDRDDSANSQE